MKGDILVCLCSSKSDCVSWFVREIVYFGSGYITIVWNWLGVIVHWEIEKRFWQLYVLSHIGKGCNFLDDRLA